MGIGEFGIYPQGRLQLLLRLQHRHVDAGLPLRGGGPGWRVRIGLVEICSLLLRLASARRLLRQGWVGLAGLQSGLGAGSRGLRAGCRIRARGGLRRGRCGHAGG